MNFDLVDIPKCDEFSKKFVEKNVRSDEIWHVQHKIDGHRRVLYKDLAGKIHAYGTRFSDVTGRREDVIDKLGVYVRGLAESMPRGMAMDGEVYVRGGQATDVPKLMKTDSPDLEFLAFGLLAIDDKPNYEPISNHFHQSPAAFKWVETNLALGEGLIRNFDLFLAELTESAKKQKIEGFVLKHSYAKKMAKLKLLQTWDLIVTGTTQANMGETGQFFGLIGALICSAYQNGRLIEVCRCSGMDLAARKAFTTGDPRGLVIEVEGQMVATKGRIRHPQFKRIRTDKSASQCIWPQNG